MPAWVFGIAAIVAFPYLIYAGRTQWFYVDDFDFFSDRRLTSFSNLMQAHAGHWSTLPIIEYRVLYKVVGLNHYWPYLVPVVLAHITAAILLYLVMGRAKVHPWIATTAGVLFLFIGAGWADILWSFQIGFTGALALGLGSLLLVDHSGNDQRRDALGAACGLGALLCSGVGVAMVASAGVAILVRRGWKVALVFVGPLAVLFVIWSASYGGSQTWPTAKQFGLFLWGIASNPFDQMAYVYGVGWVLAFVLVAGSALAIAKRDDMRSRYSTVVGLLAGFVVFVTMTSLSRGWEITAAVGDEGARVSRYVYIGIALTLPAIAAAASVLTRRRPLLVVLAVILLLIGLPGNFKQLRPQPPTAGSPAALVAVAKSPLLAKAPASLEANLPASGNYVTVGWLRSAKAAEKLPMSEPTTAYERDSAAFWLSFERRANGASTMADCHMVAANTDVRMQAGQILELPIGQTTVTLLNDSRAAIAQMLWRATGYFGDRFLKAVDSVDVRLDTSGLIDVCDQR